MKKIAIALLAAVSALSVWAQNSVGILENVTGVTLVSNGSSAFSGANSTPLIVGNRISVTSGSATLKYDNGCSLTLEANQYATVNDGQPCPVAVIVSPPVIAAPAAGSALLGGAGVLAGGGLIYILTKNNQTKTSGS